MDATTTSHQIPPPGNADTVDESSHRARDDPPQSPNRLPVAVIAQRRIGKTAAVGSPFVSQDTQDRDENSDESESVNDVAVHLFRDETPESDSDDLPPDEPSTVLASRIMRAHDNPSPPPQDLVHPGINYVPGKDGQFPLPSVSVPPSPFRPINLLERLNQFSEPLSDPPRSSRTSTLAVQSDISESGTVPPCGSISPEPSSPFIASVPVKSTLHEDLASAVTIPLSSTHFIVNDLPSRSSQHSITVSSPESVVPSSPPTQAVDSSLNLAVPSASGDSSQGPFPCSERLQSVSKSSSSTKEVDANSLQRLGSLSPHSTNVLSRLSSSVEQIILPAESIPIKHPSAPPPQTPVRAVTHPDFSWTSVQRPVIAPTPMRMNSARKLTSPAKFLLEVDNVCRTPAQRVPFETALARGTPSFQRRTQLPAEAPVFTRPALDNPSRSPAKRIAITDLVASPTRGHPAQSSPMRLVLRARSASVEPRPSGTTLARSRSVDPCAMTPKPDNHGKTRESIFPMVPILPRASTKLPFPLVPGQRSISDLPPSIPEEHENAEVGNTGIDATQGKVTQSKTVSQLRQPSTSSRIPRIGNKPYARPPTNGKATISATTANAASSPRAPPFQLACKNGGVGNNAEVSTTQFVVGPLKRKRGAEVTASANTHPIMLRQVVPGILNDKYAPKPAKLPSQVQAPSESSPPKVPQPLKFRKVVDGMLSARYAPAKPNLPQTEPSDFTSELPSPLSELSSSTSRTRKPAQQQYVLDVFNSNTSTRPPPARRKPQSRTESDYFMGMSATALKALTTSNTAKNQQIVAILATEVIRKEGLRPESPTVKARTILQKQRDERDTRRRERAQRKAQMSEDGLGSGEMDGQTELDDHEYLDVRADHDENDCAMPQKHRRGPGDEGDYETPERPSRILEPLKLEGVDRMAKPVKQVKWNRGLSTTVYLDENVPLDPLGNLVDMDNRPSPELVTEHIVVRSQEPIPAKMTRSKSKKSKS
ncbi:hypothetical protein EV363DRAFT_1319349 [Boletus edulis]|nr:hypothetical protein EV363DRAFT_1319349 [Boletus edulis]